MIPLSHSGLSEQLLSIVVAQERPDLEEQRGQLIVSRAQMSAQLAEMQSDILYGLSNSEGSPVDDLPLILTLEAIKIKSVEILVSAALFRCIAGLAFRLIYFVVIKKVANRLRHSGRQHS